MAERLSHEQLLENIRDVKERIRAAAQSAGRSQDSVRLLAATKTVDPQTINFAIENGINLIGENRVQELVEKYDSIDRANADIHFIGRLQTNKVKYIIDKGSMIHSVDSLRLAQEIDRQAAKHGLVMDILAEINIGDEASKGGVAPENAQEFVLALSKFQNIRVCGLMTIPPAIKKSDNFDENPPDLNAENGFYTADDKKVYKNSVYFKKIMKLFLDISAKKIDNIYMHELSMGMSDDFEEAVAQGATVVRVGRTLFGARQRIQTF